MEDELVRIGVPGKAQAATYEIQIEDLAPLGENSKFERVDYAKFERGFCLAIERLDDDHCIYVLIEEEWLKQREEA